MGPVAFGRVERGVAGAGRVGDGVDRADGVSALSGSCLRGNCVCSIPRSPTRSS